jgi:ABC-type lipoprotein export system ATPase subunit
MLELSHISKSYTTGTFTQKALDDVSLAFRDCEFVSILGPSGSGKTTMLNMIGGLDHFDDGDLLIDGISTKRYRDRDWDTYRNNRIGFVFQSYNLIPHQTVLANAELALTLSGVGASEREKRAREALSKVGLAEHADKKPSQLSGGQMQRVALARALVNNPEIVLADEPTGALDSETSVQVMDLLKEVAQDRLVIMVTHNPELARPLPRRASSSSRTARSDPIPTLMTRLLMPRTGPQSLPRKTAMSFLTALGLSFANLMTKKGKDLPHGLCRLHRHHRHRCDPGACERRERLYRGYRREDAHGLSAPDPGHELRYHVRPLVGEWHGRLVWLIWQLL